VIYAKVDVELRDHERITGAELADVPEEWRPAARAAMLGLFTWCLCYAQAQRSKEGLIPRATLHGALNGGQERTARHLVDVGLLEGLSSHFRIRNFALKNQTGDEISARLAAHADRQARYRDRVRKNGDGDVTRVTRTLCVTPVASDPSPSVSGSGSENARARDGGDVPQAGTLAPRVLPIDDELRAACFAIGAPEPTEQNVAEALNYARSEGLIKPDWRAYIARLLKSKRRLETNDRLARDARVTRHAPSDVTVTPWNMMPTGPVKRYRRLPDGTEVPDV
jgi:hypothetical protein